MKKARLKKELRMLEQRLLDVEDSYVELDDKYADLRASYVKSVVDTDKGLERLTDKLLDMELRIHNRIDSVDSELEHVHAKLYKELVKYKTEQEKREAEACQNWRTELIELGKELDTLIQDVQSQSAAFSSLYGQISAGDAKSRIDAVKEELQERMKTTDKQVQDMVSVFDTYLNQVQSMRRELQEKGLLIITAGERGTI